MLSRIALAAASLAFVCLPASAGLWTNPNGSLPGVLEYWNGGDLNGLYGDPSVSYNATTQELTLIFLPRNFVASSTDGVGDPVQASDTLSVDIRFDPLLIPTAFSIAEGGSYNIAGSGTVLNDSTLSLTELSGPDPLNPILGTPAVFPLNFQLDTPIGGTWSSGVTVDSAGDLTFTPTYFRIELANLLEATSSVGSTSSISKLGSEIELTIFLIPEPSSIALIGLGLLSLIRRR